jgi:RHS repeat-associated protein
MISRLWKMAAAVLGISLGLLCGRSVLAMTTTAGGETIQWDFQGIPGSSFFSAANPCAEVATNSWLCEYGLVDPPYLIPIDFVGSMTPATGSMPTLKLYYSGVDENVYNLIKLDQAMTRRPLNVEASFYIPASARRFSIIFADTASAAGSVFVQINIRIANYDYERANMSGGQEINPNTEYCSEEGQPGRPRVWKYNNKKGAGPGKCARMGLPRYWVNTASLSLVVSDTDLLYGGKGPGFRATRTYNSNAPANVFGAPVSMFGNGWSFSFDENVFSTCSGVGINQGEGNVLLFSGNVCLANPLDVALTPPEGNFDSMRLLHDDVNNVNYWLYENKKTRLRYRYDFDFSHYPKLTAITDRNGRTLTITRDPTDGTIQQIVDAAGRVSTFAYDANKRCTAMTAPNGGVSTYEYDAAGNLVKTTDLAGNVTTYTYDADRYMTALAQGDKVTHFSYSGTTAPKYVASVSNALGFGQTYMRSAPSETTVRDAADQPSVYTTNGKGLTATTTDALGASAGAREYESGLLSRYVSPPGWSLGFTYDGRGNVLTATRSTSGSGPEVTTFTYDASSNRQSRVDPENSSWVWQYEYDGNSNLTRVVRPSGNKTDYGFTGGLLTSVTDGRGYSWTFGYDAYGNKVSETDPLGHTRTRTYDSLGSVLTDTDAAGNTTTYQYDANRRVTRITNADGTFRVFQYDCCALTGITDENGRTWQFANNRLLRPTQLTDPLGNVTRYAYDANNALTSITWPDSTVSTITNDNLSRPVAFTDARGNSKSITYDGDWNISSLTDERGKTTDFYFDHGRAIAVVEPQSGNPLQVRSQWTSSWDKAGRKKVWINSRGGGLMFAYTPDGQLASKTAYPTASPLGSYAYDAARNLTQVSDGWGTTTFGYDAAGNVTSISYPTGKALSVAYLPTGRIGQMAYPTGVVVAYQYDKRNRIKNMTIGAHSVAFTYDGVGNLLSEVRSNGTSSTYTYDARNQIVSIRHAKGVTPFSQMSYVRNAMGNITRETGFQPLAPTLASSSVAGSYNHVNQIASWAGDSHAYDADGNLVAITGSRSVTAAYDNENQLTNLTQGGGTATHTYDGRGQRVKTQRAAGPTHYHYDAAGRMVFQTDGAGHVTASYFYSGNRLVAMSTAAGGHYFYHFDRIGSTLALTDSSGNMAVAYAYLPFGESVKQATQGDVANPFTYVGAYGVQDDGNGIYLMSSRAYDARTGKFLQKDRISLNGGSNLYAYAGSNPINLIDPAGTEGSPPGRASVNVENKFLVGVGNIVATPLLVGFSWAVGNPLGIAAGVARGCMGTWQVATAIYDRVTGQDDKHYSGANSLLMFLPGGGYIQDEYGEYVDDLSREEAVAEEDLDPNVGLPPSRGSGRWANY